jgi:phosphoglycerate dehydrogenase-like enzyme
VVIFRLASTGDFLDVHGRPAYGDNGLSRLASEPNVRHTFLTRQAPRAGDPTYWERFYSLEVEPDEIAGLDGLIVLRPQVKRRAIAAAKDLVVIGRSGAGYEKIDVAACTDYDIALFNCPRGLDHATASSALMFMLVLAKRLKAQEQIARTARWDLQAESMGSELAGRTLGIVGLGNSGKELVRLASPFAMRVLAYSPHADPDEARSLGVALMSLDDLLRQSDFVSLHARYTSEVHHLIAGPQLALMKPTAYLVNIARGGLVDQAALVAALAERRIAGAALDVFEREPLPADDPLIKLDNVVLTPHWSCSTRDVWAATGFAMCEGMLRAARGELPEHVVNCEVLDRPGFRAKLARFTANRKVTH